jgi:hypothetical protein
MTELIFERDYAREMVFAAMRHQADGSQPTGASDVTMLIDRAAEAGCSRSQLMVELASLGARLLARSAPEDRQALAREIVDVIAC